MNRKKMASVFFPLKSKEIGNKKNWLAFLTKVEVEHFAFELICACCFFSKAHHLKQHYFKIWFLVWIFSSLIIWNLFQTHYFHETRGNFQVPAIFLSSEPKFILRKGVSSSDLRMKYTTKKEGGKEAGEHIVEICAWTLEQKNASTDSTLLFFFIKSLKATNIFFLFLQFDFFFASLFFYLACFGSQMKKKMLLSYTQGGFEDNYVSAEWVK